MSCWLWHKWGKWSEPYKVERESIRPFGFGEWFEYRGDFDGYKKALTIKATLMYQKRQCLRCGKVESREI